MTSRFTVCVAACTWLIFGGTSSAEFFLEDETVQVQQISRNCATWGTVSAVSAGGASCRSTFVIPALNRHGRRQPLTICPPVTVCGVCCDHCQPEVTHQAEIEVCGYEEAVTDSLPVPPPEHLGSLGGPWQLDVPPTGHSMGGLPYSQLSGGTGGISSFGGVGGSPGGGGGGGGGGRGFPPGTNNEPPPTDTDSHVAPLPSSFALLLTGTLGLAFVGAWRRRNKAA